MFTRSASKKEIITAASLRERLARPITYAALLRENERNIMLGMVDELVMATSNVLNGMTQNPSRQFVVNSPLKTFNDFVTYLTLRTFRIRGFRVERCGISDFIVCLEPFGKPEEMPDSTQMEIEWPEFF